MGEQEQRNKELVRRRMAALDRGLETGDFSELDSYYVDGHIAHNHPYYGDTDDGTPFLERLHQALEAARRSFGEREHAVVMQVAEGDLVVTYLATTLTHTGEFDGLPATGRVVRLNQVVIDRFVDGLVSESWGVGDALGFLRQLGATVGFASAVEP
jgi:predicted ester cyclase